ncbi:MAG: hypothetical protein ACYDHM_14400 [Acidiferrobacterales bacterium]
MDHRWTIGKVFEHEVLICCHAVRPGRGQMRDIRVDGIFIALPKFVLQRGALVDMAMMRRTPGVRWMRQILAEVLRLTEDGIGFMFVLNDAGKISTFRRVASGHWASAES